MSDVSACDARPDASACDACFDASPFDVCPDMSQPYNSPLFKAQDTLRLQQKKQRQRSGYRVRVTGSPRPCALPSPTVPCFDTPSAAF